MPAVGLAAIRAEADRLSRSRAGGWTTWASWARMRSRSRSCGCPWSRARLAARQPQLAGRRVALLEGGGNIDPALLSRVIEKGLVRDGRLTRVTAVISDRPGGLAELSRVIAKRGASIRDIAHDRAFSGPDVSAVRVACTVETRDRAHLGALHRALRKSGFPPGAAG